MVNSKPFSLFFTHNIMRHSILWPLNQSKGVKMKKLLLMVAVAVTLLMGSSVFAHNANHGGSSHGWNNNHGQNHHGQHRPRKHRRRAMHHCHYKQVRVRVKDRGHNGGGHGHGHGHKRHHQKWKWVTVSDCHAHRKSRRGHKHH